MNSKKLEMAQHKFMEGIGRMSHAFGFNKFVAQLYALLYLNGRPFSLDEMVEVLGVSKGNISINIRELERWGAVKNVWVKGSRKDFYQADPDIKKIFLNKVKSALAKRSSEISNLAEEFGQALNSLDGDLTPEENVIVSAYNERLKALEEFKHLATNAALFLEKLV